MTKNGPWLKKFGDGWESDDDQPWLCHEGTAAQWNIQGAYWIRICGSTEPMQRTIREIDSGGYMPWYRGTLDDGYEYYRLMHHSLWLKSFNSPVVYIWIEGWWK